MLARRFGFGGLIAAIAALAVMAPVTVTAQEDEPLRVSLELVAEGLTAPVDFEQAPDTTNRYFVVDQIGVIYVIQDGERLPDPFLDLRDRLVELNPQYDERGLLGLTFHPEFDSNGRFYVYYTGPLRDGAPEGWDSTNYLVEFATSSDDSNAADMATERMLMAFDKPQGNHNGGDISFGPDGFLYVPLGDGGGGDDTDEGHTPNVGNGQDISNVLGSILRIDVDGGDPYGIPADNPFLTTEGVPPETWAYGFRNPWRASWDMDGNGRYFVSDAGQEMWEEVSLVTGGNNYGWNLMEGAHCFNPADAAHNPLDCARTGAGGEPLINPIIELSHTNGPVIVGGYVYRGGALPGPFGGQYIFAFWDGNRDLDQALLFAANGSTSGDAATAMWLVDAVLVADTDHNNVPGYVLAFGQDASGEVYILTSQEAGPMGDTGKVYRLVPAAAEDAGGDGGEATEATGDDTAAETTDDTAANDDAAASNDDAAAANDDAAAANDDAEAPASTPEAESGG